MNSSAPAVVPSLAMPQHVNLQHVNLQHVKSQHLKSQWQVVSSGFRSLDQLLPSGGLRRGSLVEWLADDDAGAVALAAAVACRLVASPTLEPAASRPATIVVVDRGARFHPPAVLPWLGLPGLGASAVSAGRNGSGGVAARPQLVVARPARDDDELWAIDQSLRCPGVAAVLAWPRRVHATAMRRWQLAARASGTVGLFVRIIPGGATSGGGTSGGGTSGGGMTRPTDALRAVRREPTWADARVAVSSLEAADHGVEHVAGCGMRAGGMLAGGTVTGGTVTGGTVTGGATGAAPSVRRLRLSLVGGPWAGDAMLEERAAELWLDLASGGEAARRRHVTAPRCAASRDEITAASLGGIDAVRDAAGVGGVACRAS